MNPPSTRKVSSRLAGALSHLAGDGQIAGSSGPPTGYWDYLKPAVTYWGPLPEPDKDDTTTWVEYALANGLKPGEWLLPE